MNKEQAKQIKEQLIQQVLTWNISEEQKQKKIEQINAMSEKELEEFLVKNNLIKKEEKGKKQECVFCLILENKIPSFKIAENKDNIALLEINPISKGHSLIVPRKHLNLEALPISSFSLAKKIARSIKSRLKPKEVKISPISMFNHALIEVIPLYGDEKGERKKASEPELKSLQAVLEIKKSEQKEKKTKKEKSRAKKSDVTYAPRRIP